MLCCAVICAACVCTVHGARCAAHVCALRGAHNACRLGARRAVHGVHGMCRLGARCAVHIVARAAHCAMLADGRVWCAEGCAAHVCPFSVSPTAHIGRRLSQNRPQDGTCTSASAPRGRPAHCSVRFCSPRLRIGTYSRLFPSYSAVPIYTVGRCVPFQSPICVLGHGCAVQRRAVPQRAAILDAEMPVGVVRYRIARNGGTLEHRFASGMIVYDCRLGRATAPPYRSTRNTRPHTRPIPRIPYAFAVRPMRSRPMPSCYDMCGR